MDKPLAALEITSTSVKLVIGYVLDDEVDVLYAITKNAEGVVSNGEVVDLEKAKNIVASLSSIRDESAKLKINASEVICALPPIGLEVYQNNKITNVVSPNSIIDKIDISNVISLVRKEQINDTEEIVDIIPDVFVLDQGRAFTNPPIGQTSNSLTINAKVHTLPKHIIEGYRNTITLANMRVQRLVVTPYAVADLLRTYKEVPEYYLLIDMGANITTLSIVGQGKLYASTHFFKGGDDLTNKIETKFSITREEAKRIKELYGLDNRELSVHIPIVSGRDELGNNRKFYTDDLNNVIRSFLDDYIKDIKLSLNALLSKYNEKYAVLPLVFVGGGSRLNGLEEVLKEKFPNNKSVQIVVPHSLGTRDQCYLNCLALIKVASIYRGTLEDDRTRVAPLTRAQGDQINKPYSELEDDL